MYTKHRNIRKVDTLTADAVMKKTSIAPLVLLVLVASQFIASSGNKEIASKSCVCVQNITIGMPTLTSEGFAETVPAANLY